MYETISYSKVQSTMAILAGFESVLTLVSLLTIIPGRRRLKKTIIVGCLLLLHVDLLTSFFCLDERLVKMQIKVQFNDTFKDYANYCKVKINPNMQYHFESSDMSTSLRIAMFVSSVVAGVLLLRFLHLLFDQKAEFDEIADEYRYKMKDSPLPSFHVKQPPNVAVVRKSVDSDLDTIPV